MGKPNTFAKICKKDESSAEMLAALQWAVFTDMTVPYACVKRSSANTDMALSLTTHTQITSKRHESASRLEDFEAGSGLLHWLLRGRDVHRRKRGKVDGSNCFADVQHGVSLLSGRQ
jgi:hypothetical protein